MSEGSEEIGVGFVANASVETTSVQEKKDELATAASEKAKEIVNKVVAVKNEDEEVDQKLEEEIEVPLEEEIMTSNYAGQKIAEKKTLQLNQVVEQNPLLKEAALLDKILGLIEEIRTTASETEALTKGNQVALQIELLVQKAYVDLQRQERERILHKEPDEHVDFVDTVSMAVIENNPQGVTIWKSDSEEVVLQDNRAREDTDRVAQELSENVNTFKSIIASMVELTFPKSEPLSYSPRVDSSVFSEN